MTSAQVLLAAHRGRAVQASPWGGVTRTTSLPPVDLWPYGLLDLSAHRQGDISICRQRLVCSAPSAPGRPVNQTRSPVAPRSAVEAGAPLGTRGVEDRHDPL